LNGPAPQTPRRFGRGELGLRYSGSQSNVAREKTDLRARPRLSSPEGRLRAGPMPALRARGDERSNNRSGPGMAELALSPYQANWTPTSPRRKPGPSANDSFVNRDVPRAHPGTRAPSANDSFAARDVPRAHPRTRAPSANDSFVTRDVPRAPEEPRAGATSAPVLPAHP
jgi:hypothetical protein